MKGRSGRAVGDCECGYADDSETNGDLVPPAVIALTASIAAFPESTTKQTSKVGWPPDVGVSDDLGSNPRKSATL
jgi:hypothetical protein